MTQFDVSEPIDLTVVTVTHGGRDLALATLRSAMSSAGPISAEWIVVDNGSSDGTPAAIREEFPGVRLLEGRNVGFAAGNNRGLTHARGRYVLLLNPDVEIVHGKLADLVVAMDARPHVGAASVVQETGEGRLMHSIMRFPSVARALGEALSAGRIPGLARFQEPETQAERYERERAADWVSGAFLIVRSDAIRDVGRLDERFFMYSEETDWCYRLRGAKWDVRHLPVMRIRHYGGAARRPASVAELTRSKLLFARKHFGPARRALFRAALILRHGLRALLVVPVAGRRPDLTQRAEAERAGLLVALGRDE